MEECADCASIVENRAGAPGHANLVSLGHVRALHLVQRGITHEAFSCATCGANWDYLHDRRNAASGWARCDRTTPDRAQPAATQSVDDTERGLKAVS